MNQDLVDEIDEMRDLLTKSGFFSKDETIEILEDQFIEYDIDFSGYDIPANVFIVLKMWSRPLRKIF